MLYILKESAVCFKFLVGQTLIFLLGASTLKKPDPLIEMALLTVKELAFLFGLLGNIVSFLVFLAPGPTFYKIYKKKSAEGYHCLPYVVALSSATLLLYYGVLKTHAEMIISINAIGCIIEVAYLIFYVIYATEAAKISTLKLVLLCNGSFGVMMALTTFLLNRPERVTAVGWMCAIYNLAVFAAPLSIMRQVIRTKSVEYMPFFLSLFLTLCAIMWFLYGFLIRDFYISLPNVLGFLFGIAQMILYLIYKDGKKKIESKPEQNAGDVKLIPIDIAAAKTIIMDMKVSDSDKLNESNVNNV